FQLKLAQQVLQQLVLSPPLKYDHLSLLEIQYSFYFSLVNFVLNLRINHSLDYSPIFPYCLNNSINNIIQQNIVQMIVFICLLPCSRNKSYEFNSSYRKPFHIHIEKRERDDLCDI